MATGISSAERLPDADYSVSHRPPPPTPGFAAATTPAIHESSSDAPSSPTTRQLRVVNEVSPETVSVKSGSERRPRHQGSLGSFSFLRRSTSRNSASRERSPDQNSEDVPPLPLLPNTRIGQAHWAAQTERATPASNTNRKISIEGGRTMLRKSSKLKAQEQERLEQERLARANAPPPRLPTQQPLPGIATFGGDDANHNNPNFNSGRSANNFSRPGQNPYGSTTNGNSNMPHNMQNYSSSSPAYAVRGGSSPPGKSSGEYVERHESMTNRGRYSYASSTVGVNVSSPRRIRRRKDPTPFK